MESSSFSFYFRRKSKPLFSLKFITSFFKLETSCFWFFIKLMLVYFFFGFFREQSHSGAHLKEWIVFQSFLTFTRPKLLLVSSAYHLRGVIDHDLRGVIDHDFFFWWLFKRLLFIKPRTLFFSLFRALHFRVKIELI